MSAAMAVAALAAAAFGAGTNISMFHMHQANYSGITNMNTADAAGDAYFTLFEFAVNALCQENPTDRRCRNPEGRASDRIISHVIAEQLDPRWAGYGFCNVCINNTLPSTKPPEKCVRGEYKCSCGGKGGNRSSENCKPQIGREKVSYNDCWSPHPGDPDYLFWRYNLRRIGGYWYSTIDRGENITWRVVEEKKSVNASCHSAEFHRRVKVIHPSCFDECAQPDNVTTACVVNCTFEALLGPESGTTVNSTGGLPGDNITAIWMDSFEACPHAIV